MMIEVSDAQAQALLVLLRDGVATAKARNTSADLEGPDEDDLQAAMQVLDPEAELLGEMQPGDSKLATPAERARAAESRNLESVHTYARTGRPQRYGAGWASEEEISLANRISQRTGASFTRSLASLRYQRRR